MTTDLEGHLDRYAALLVRVGVNLQPGQRLLVSTDVTCAPLARLVTRHAYDAGAPLVNVVFTDAPSTRVRLAHAAPESLDHFPEWRAALWRETAERGDAFLHVTSEDPALLDGIDPARVDRERLARQQALRPFSELLRRNAFAWCRAAAPSTAWAARVFPHLRADEAVARLWSDVLEACRADVSDPVAAWRAHLAELEGRADELGARRYGALHFRGPGTDLTVGLADTHVWVGGAARTPGGVRIVPNLPAEEVFTAPHRARVEGVVRATRPLSLSGVLVEGIELRFEAGRIVEARATRGEEVLLRALDSDDGARYLGEVALVPVTSAVARTGTLFLDSVYDENAACHLAFGASYRENFAGGEALSDEEVASLGGNDSVTHVDFMIGGEHVDVDGVREGGARDPLMRGGVWAF
ncbi:aminopeptidase [Deinococcus pimensis]|uniref:aminopeptidase n=1 Tax=Deinococcus pimensis TaxID=309888 RepID=UPI000484D0EA|nr:aminopeptidase [Deinococcus pimensis]